MPNYSFRFKFDGVEFEEVASNFPNEEAALEEAVRTCGEITRDEASNIKPGQDCWIEVGETKKEPRFRVHVFVEERA